MGLDFNVKQNACLVPIMKPPFYAIQVYPDEIGAKGGFVTDENATYRRCVSYVHKSDTLQSFFSLHTT